MSNNRFCADYAKRGTSACKKCKKKIEKGTLRLGKILPNPFSDGGGDMKQWFHVACIFETFIRARATTKKIEDASDIEGWEKIEKDDQEMILKHISDVPNSSNKATPKKVTPSKQTKPSPSTSTGSPDPKASVENGSSVVPVSASHSADVQHRDNSFREFRRLCANIAEESSYNAKTKIVADFFSKGTDGVKFHGDLYLWVKLLLPGFVKRVYNLQSKQLVNHFSQIFATNVDDMVEDLEKGDVADTIQTFFEKSNKCAPARKSTLSIHDLDRFLEELTLVTKDDDQIRVLKNIAKVSTANDLKAVIRLIKKDLRINAGAKHILEGVHKDAYEAFQTTRNLKDVIDRVQENKAANGVPGMTKALSIRASLMTPILPMLAEACKSVEYAMKKCPNGMYAEIKYDGERVQVHKQANQFSYFSRSLKPVLPHKVEHFKEYIPKAFPHGRDLILDSEVLLIDTRTSTPLPFGTLGVHKKAAFKDANVCLFVFDCIHFNGENLTNKPLKERRLILKENMTEVPNHVQFSEMKHITKCDDLKDMIMEVLRKGLEGLVLKDCMGTYEPGKRHWLKVKKDYLAEGVMADSADLVVLGAFYGTGNKGGMMSIFLMGCYDADTDCWCTVTKVSGGHDDKTLDQLQGELKMVKISKDMSKVPSWLKVTKNMVPDFICEDPKDSQVWEIVGAEFSKAEIHTAKGISIRFPRVTRIRRDKTWKEATTLSELEDLFIKSKDHENFPDVLGSSSSPNKLLNNGKLLENEAISQKASPGKHNSSPIKGQTTISQFITKTPDKKDKAKVKSEAVKSESAGHKRKSDEASSSAPPAIKKAKVEGTQIKPIPEILPSVFTGMKILLTESIHNQDVLQRYIIAYDGDVVDEFHSRDATHVIAVNDSDVPRNVSKVAEIISEQWLLDSIKLLKSQKTAKYKML